MVHMRELPEYVKDLAREIFNRYKPRRITLDSKGKPNPISVFNFVRTLYQWLMESGISDIQTKLYEIIDYIDPDLSREENARILYNMIMTSTRHRLDRLAYDMDYFREIDRQAEEYARELMKKELEETAKETPSMIEEKKREPELDFYDASIIFEKKLLDAGLDPYVLIDEFKKLWEQGKVPRTKKELEKFIDEFIERYSTKTIRLEITEPIKQIVKKYGIPEDIIKKIKERNISFEELEQFRKQRDRKDPCSYLFINELIDYDDFRYCQDIYFKGKYSKQTSMH